MLRRILTIFSLIGLLLCVGLWGVSGRCEARLWIGRFGMAICHGMIYCDWDYTGQSHFLCYGEALEMYWVPFYFLGQFGCPLWIPTVVFASVFWSCYLPFHRRRKRKKLGLCIKCGYNLKGLTEPRCPECNTQFEKTCSAKP